jgi:uncharacterized protein
MTGVHSVTDPVLSADVAAATREKASRLQAWLRDAGSVLVGFSGGVDSAFLAAAAIEALGPDRVLCVVGRSASYPEAQWETARRVAREFALPLLEVDTHEVDDPQYAANPVNRCYFCKTELWHVLTPIARERGIAVVIDGTNADDLRDYRPGAAAAKEQGVRSPLAEVGLTKAEIRELSRARGLPTWSQPSSPCLSSRIPYHTAVTTERLRQVERAEQALRDLGVQGDFRVRHHGELARVELSRADLERFIDASRAESMRVALVAAGYERVAIDLRGFRSGSLNVLEGVVAAGA